MNGCGPNPFGRMLVRVGSRPQKYPDWKQLMWLAYRLWDVLISDPPKKSQAAGEFWDTQFSQMLVNPESSKIPRLEKKYTNVKIPHEFSVPFWEHPKLGHLFLWCPCSRSLKWGARSWAKDWHKIALFRPIFLYQFGELDDIEKEDDQKGPKKNELLMNFWQVELIVIVVKIDILPRWDPLSLEYISWFNRYLTINPLRVVH